VWVLLQVLRHARLSAPPPPPSQSLLTLSPPPVPSQHIVAPCVVYSVHVRLDITDSQVCLFVLIYFQRSFLFCFLHFLFPILPSYLYPLLIVSLYHFSPFLCSFLLLLLPPFPLLLFNLLVLLFLLCLFSFNISLPAPPYLFLSILLFLVKNAAVFLVQPRCVWWSYPPPPPPRLACWIF
jgi:hypothetical protein